jgi:hypothetical protein
VIVTAATITTQGQEEQHEKADGEKHCRENGPCHGVTMPDEYYLLVNWFRQTERAKQVYEYERSRVHEEAQ